MPTLASKMWMGGGHTYEGSNHWHPPLYYDLHFIELMKSTLLGGDWTIPHKIGQRLLREIW